MGLEKEWKNEPEGEFYQTEERKGESSWHRKELNILTIY